MPRYSLRVRRQVNETLIFTVEAESDVQAHEIADRQAKCFETSGSALAKPAETVVSVVACHRVKEQDKS